jgi:hypothetical protein
MSALSVVLVLASASFVGGVVRVGVILSRTSLCEDLSAIRRTIALRADQPAAVGALPPFCKLHACTTMLSMHRSQGVSGFGSAILHILVWVICTSAGVDAGSLQLAVVVECINSVVSAIPLLLLARALTNTNWPLLFSMTIATVRPCMDTYCLMPQCSVAPTHSDPPPFLFSLLSQSAFVPLGAVMLVVLDVNMVELVMAISLVVVIALRLGAHTWLYDKATEAVYRLRGRSVKGGPGGWCGGGRVGKAQVQERMLASHPLPLPCPCTRLQTVHCCEAGGATQ